MEASLRCFCGSRAGHAIFGAAGSSAGQIRDMVRTTLVVAVVVAASVDGVLAQQGVPSEVRDIGIAVAALAALIVFSCCVRRFTPRGGMFDWCKEEQDPETAGVELSAGENRAIETYDRCSCLNPCGNLLRLVRWCCGSGAKAAEKGGSGGDDSCFSCFNCLSCLDCCGDE